MLLRSHKPIVLAVNKMDSTGRVDPDFYEFYNLGLGDPIAVSAVHGHGTGDLLDACLQYFPPEDDEEEDEDVIKVAIIGKPNVGKSSLTNRILGTERMIVSNVAGTTRDARRILDDGEPLADELIKQHGLADVRPSNDRNQRFHLSASFIPKRRAIAPLFIAKQNITNTV